MHRDGHFGIGPRDDEAFPAYLDRVNEEWVEAARRMSPRLLTDLLASAGDEIVAFWRTVDLRTSATGCAGRACRTRCAT